MPTRRRVQRGSCRTENVFSVVDHVTHRRLPPRLSAESPRRRPKHTVIRAPAAVLAAGGDSETRERARTCARPMLEQRRTVCARVGVPAVEPEPRASPPSQATMTKKGKLRMREWLIENLDTGRFKGTLEWYRDDGCSEGVEVGRRRLFRIKWLHASTGHYTENDSDLFREWCHHTGKLKGTGDSSKRWKANFRCALNSLPDVTPVVELTVRKGKNAYRVFEILDEKLPEKVAKKRESNLKSSNKKPKKRKITRIESSDDATQRKRAPVTRVIKLQQQQQQQRPPRRDVSAVASNSVGYSSLLDSINCSGSNGSTTRSSSSYSDLPSTVEDMNNNDDKEEVEEEIVFDSMIEGSSAATAADVYDMCDAFEMEHDRFADYGHDTNSGSSTLSSAADLADVQTEELLSDLAAVIPLPLCDVSAELRSSRNVIVRSNILNAHNSGLLACQMEDVGV